MEPEKRKPIKRKWIIIGSVLLLLIVARLMLPYFVTRYVNKVLSEIPGYSGSISGVEIALIRGAYIVNDLKLFKVDGTKKVPFIDIKSTDLSVEWQALFDGAIVGEVVFWYPKLNFVGGSGKGEDKPGTDNQYGADVDWTDPIKKLLPLQINRLEIVDGIISYFDFTTQPKVDVSITKLNAIATNLNNAKDLPNKLPSSVRATATSIGGGKLDLKMGINVLKEIPDMDMNMKFEGIDMPALNDFFLAYTKVDIERGKFNLFAELAVDGGRIHGYVKPIAKNIKVVDFKKDKKDPVNLIWQSIVGFLAELFENQKQDQFATRIPLDGNLKEIKAGVWPTVWSVFSNAFVRAFAMTTENTVSFTDLEKVKPAKDRKEEKKQARKERKKERKQERQRQKQDDDSKSNKQ